MCEADEEGNPALILQSFLIEIVGEHVGCVEVQKVMTSRSKERPFSGAFEIPLLTMTCDRFKSLLKLGVGPVPRTDFRALTNGL